MIASIYKFNSSILSTNFEEFERKVVLLKLHLMPLPFRLTFVEIQMYFMKVDHPHFRLNVVKVTLPLLIRHSRIGSHASPTNLFEGILSSMKLKELISL